MVDLHIHSTESDGQYTPKEIVKIAVKKGLKAIALTDHDTVDGLIEASQIAKKVEILFIPGIELSIQGLLGVKELHILGYWIDPNSKDLRELCWHGQMLRERRAEKIYTYLREKGVSVKPEIVERFAGNAPIGRPHFARAMVEMGYVSDTRQAFDRYLDTPEFKQIPRPLPTVEEGIETILAAGGVPVLAHPIQTHLIPENLEKLLVELKAAGLQGLECYYSAHSPNDTQFYLQLAQKYDLFVTGGSDFHGERIKPSIQMGSGINNQLYVPDDLEILYVKEQRDGR